MRAVQGDGVVRGSQGAVGAAAVVLVAAAQVLGELGDLGRVVDAELPGTPLRPAPDAIVVDSTDLDREGVVDRVVELAVSAVGVGERA